MRVRFCMGAMLARTVKISRTLSWFLFAASLTCAGIAAQSTPGAISADIAALVLLHEYGHVEGTDPPTGSNPASDPETDPESNPCGNCNHAGMFAEAFNIIADQECTLIFEEYGYEELYDAYLKTLQAFSHFSDLCQASDCPSKGNFTPDMLLQCCELYIQLPEVCP